jgi:PII-like signaling protein
MRKQKDISTYHIHLGEGKKNSYPSLKKPLLNRACLFLLSNIGLTVTKCVCGYTRRAHAHAENSKKGKIAAVVESKRYKNSDISGEKCSLG